MRRLTNNSNPLTRYRHSTLEANFRFLTWVRRRMLLSTLYKLLNAKLAQSSSLASRSHAPNSDVPVH